MSALPEDITQVAFLLRYGLFDTRYDGFIRSASDEEVDTWRATLFARHHFGEGWAVDAVLPTGIARGQNVLGEKSRLTGLGDLRSGVRYELAALWGAGAYRPSVVVSGGLALPTGDQGRFGELSDEIPVTVLALGRGAFASNVRVEATQFVSRSVALSGWAGAELPLSQNTLGVQNGVQLDYGVGVVALPWSWAQLSARVAGQTLTSAESEQFGVLVNSGGTLAAFEAQVGVRASKKLHLSVGARTPLAAFLNGKQVAESFSLFSSVSMSFGQKEDEHDHGEGDEHDHGDEHGDEHDHGAEKNHDEHDHGAEKNQDEHDHGAEKNQDEHDHDTEKNHDEHDASSSSPASSPASVPAGDVTDLARGGASFDLQALKTFSAEQKRVVVVDFWAEWCAPCKALDKRFAEMSAEHSQLSVRKVEVPDFDCAAAKEHIKNASGLPVVWVISPSGEIVKLEKATQAQVEVSVIEALRVIAGQ